jgi:NADPH:quinone reductase-like Zn-dependent oxidoreductase
MPIPSSSLQLQTWLTSDAQLQLRLARVALAEPAPEEVVIRVEAAPINPSDIGAMFGPSDISRMRADGAGDTKQVAIPMPPQAMLAMAAKVGQPLSAGVEGAGIVVAAGSSAKAQMLLGKVVAVSIGGMYAQYRVANVADLLVMKGGTTPVEAASSFINPLTALGMLETMRREGHSALVQTAAASNLGRMLNRVCLADGVPLVNIVRDDSQAKILKDMGAEHVLNSSSEDFPKALTVAIGATNATLCFHPIGGGKLVSQILTAMETVQTAKLRSYQRYGSGVHKQVYICGLLDSSPTELTHTFGLSWGVGGWLLPNFLAQIDPEASGRLQNRVVNELSTTFASHYTRTISLREALEPAIITAYCRRATGEKYLIAPQL